MPIDLEEMEMLAEGVNKVWAKNLSRKLDLAWEEFYSEAQDNKKEATKKLAAYFDDLVEKEELDFATGKAVWRFFLQGRDKGDKPSPQKMPLSQKDFFSASPGDSDW